MFTSWRTTLSGIIAGIGLITAHSTDPKIQAIGTIAAAIGVIVFGAVSRDNKVTSEQAGAK